jgi:hypothetical protein
VVGSVVAKISAGTIHLADIEGSPKLHGLFRRVPPIFVGPVIDREVVTLLNSMPNVRVGDMVPQREIPGLIHSVEVCIMLLPHRRNDLTKSMSPLNIVQADALGRYGTSVARKNPVNRGRRVKE